MYDKIPIARYATPQGYKNIADITTTIRVKQKVVEEGAYPINVSVPDMDRPEVFANRVYGRAGTHWIILNLNNIVNPYYEWVLSPQSLDNYIDEKYPGYTMFLLDTSGTKPFTGSFRVNDIVFATGVTNPDLQPSVQSSLKNARVVTYDPAYCRLVIEFTQKTAWIPVEGDYISGSNVDTAGVTQYYVAKIGKVIESPFAAHHFEYQGEILNPTLPVSLNNKFLTASDFGYTFGGTPLGRYIFEDFGDYTVTNREYEIEVNDSHRNIELVSKPYIANIEKEVEASLNNV